MKVKTNTIEIALDRDSVREKQAGEYPDLMMECLSDVTKFDYILVIEDGLFSVVRNSNYDGSESIERKESNSWMVA
jgi:hypothetical protein